MERPATTTLSLFLTSGSAGAVERPETSVGNRQPSRCFGGGVGALACGAS